jgi:hypothetical protein
MEYMRRGCPLRKPYTEILEVSMYRSSVLTQTRANLPDRWQQHQNFLHQLYGSFGQLFMCCICFPGRHSDVAWNPASLDKVTDSVS